MPFSAQVFVLVILAVFMVRLLMVFAHIAAYSSKSIRQINTILALMAIINFFIVCYLYARHTWG